MHVPALLAGRAPWYIAGPLLGILVVALRWAGNLHLGATGSFVGVAEWLRAPRRPGWRAFFFLGILGGGVLSMLLSPGAHAASVGTALDPLLGSSLAAKAFVLVAAGLLMGLGARTAGGCTSGHGICGTSQGSPASFAATATFMAVAIVSTRLWALLVGGAS